MVAPEIEFVSGFKGTVQVFAKHSLIVQRNCTLTYPSALTIFNKSDNADASLVSLAENSQIEGVLYAFQAGRSSKDCQLIVERNARLIGEVITNGEVELKGSIAGGIMCKSFIAKSDNSSYTNHLVDAEIDYSALPDNFIHPVSSASETPKRIIKWLE